MAHDFELERTALYALGVLPEKETEEAESHLISCAPCMAEYIELRDTASYVGISAEVVGGEHDLRLKRIERKLKRTLDRNARQPFEATIEYDGWYRAVAAAALLVAFGASFWSYSLKREVTKTQAALSSNRRELFESGRSATVANERLGVLLAPDARRYDVATGVVVARAGHVYLAMSKLPPLTPGHVFQAWTLAKGATKVVPSITFTRDASGTTFVVLPMPGLPAAVALSVEPAGGSQQPTTKPLFVQPLV